MPRGGGVEREELLYNLKFFEKLVPVILSEKELRYHIYYYYDKVNSHFASSTLMPYVIITSDYVINISVDLNHGLISKDREVINLYSHLYDMRKRESRPMIQKLGANAEYIGLCQEKPESHPETIYSIGSQPCFGLFDVESMFFKYIKGDNTESACQFQQLVQSNKQFVFDGKLPVVSYFSKEGLKQLMKNGIVEEVPRELYTCLDMEDRKKLIKMLIEAVRDGWYTAYLMDDEAIRYPKSLIVTTREITSVNIFYLPEKNESRFALKEQSLSKMIYEFLADFQKSTYVINRDDTLKYLEKIIR